MKIARNRLGAAIAAAALLALTACSGSGGSDGPKAGSTPTASVSPATDGTVPDATAIPSEGTPEIAADLETGKIDYCKDRKTPFTGPAADKWGAKKVMAAYCDMVTLTMDNEFRPSMVREHDSFVAKDFSVPRDWMTEDARKSWDANVAKIVKGNVKDYSNPVLSVMLYNVTFDRRLGYDFYPEQKEDRVMVDQKLSAGDAWIDTSQARPRLGLEFTVSGNWLLTNGKGSYLWPMDRKHTFWLTENGRHPTKPWLIDGWTGTTKFGKPVKHPVPEPSEQSPSSDSAN
jgi:hypothetical protein